MNLNKVRRVLKAKSGLQTPSFLWNGITLQDAASLWKSSTTSSLLGNPYMRSDGIAKPSGTEIVSEETPGLSLTDVNQGIDFILKLGLFLGYKTDNSSISNGIRLGYDFVANKVPGPAGMYMKAAGFVSDVLSSAGLRTDLLTTTDKILGGIPIINNLTSIGAKKTRQFSMNKDAIDKAGGSYTGTVNNINKAVEKAGKSYSPFSSGSRRETNRFIDKTSNLQTIMAGIANEASDRASIAANMSDLNHLQYGFNINGGIDQRYIRANRNGAILQRVKRIDFHKKGGKVSVNELWVPEIIDPIESFEEGGKVKDEEIVEDIKLEEGMVEWTPTIIESFQEGGKSLKVDGITGATPKITFESWYKLVPEDRLSSNYDLKKAFLVLPFEELEAWRTSSNEDLEKGKNHLRSIYLLSNGDYEFLKLGNEKTNPEVHFETDTYHSGENGLKDSHDLIFEGDRYFYRKKPKLFKNGGKPEIEEPTLKNVIPEGALHAHKHHMDNAEELTKKGIPVVDNEGELQAEIERNELILTLEVTKKLEELYKEGTDEAAIEAGKLLVLEILFNTEDRTGLIDTLKQGGKINGIE